jgi:hypothetical protein
MKPVIACVLKSGLFKPWGHKDYTVQYGPQNVLWLRDQCEAHIGGPHRFICLTDMDIPGVETRPLQDNLPGWWSKLELFREFDHAAYLDLSSVLLGDVGPHLFADHRFTMSAHMTRRHGVNSGVMCWKGDYRFIYAAFIQRKDQVMAEYVHARQWGDQDFIKDMLNSIGSVAKFQSRWPDFILSYKYDIMHRTGPQRAGTRRRIRLRGEWWKEPHIVKFHGSPKPHEVTEPWLPQLCAA